ncbi:MAG: sugar transferase [Halioglobus sp.]
MTARQSPFPARPWQRACQRGFDIIAASAGLLALAPVLLGIALLVAAGSGRPVLHRERRIGRHGVPFTLLKFRTLRPGGGTQRSIAPEDDPRITRVGLPLRRTRLDELPQLFNVLAGDMSLVGPRPMVQQHVDALDPGVREALLRVRPGVTDPASVLFFAEDAVLCGVANAETVYLQYLLPAKAQVQLDYLSHWHLVRDLCTIVQTFARVWSPRARRDSIRRVQAILSAAARPANPAPPPPPP